MLLDGVDVLDLTRLVPGSFTTQLLCDLGADVVKVEEPDVGDYGRYLPPQTDENVSALFSAVNRGKLSVTLNLKTEADRKAFYHLVAEADVVIESFRPGVAEHLGIDYNTLVEHNDDLIYCSLSGYGQEGPYSDRAGHDLNYAGIAGLLDMNRPGPDAEPTLPGAQVADLAGGLFAAFIIAGHLAGHARAGDGGDYIDVSMTDIAYTVAMLGPLYAMTGQEARPGRMPLGGGLPCYDVYETADSRYVTLAALEPKFWLAFCDAVDRPDLLEAHQSDDPDQREALADALRDIFAERTRAEWDVFFEGTDVPFGVVNTPTETLSDPQLTARGMASLGPEGRSVPHLRFPAIRQRHDRADHIEWPELGEHTAQLLREVGYNEAELCKVDGYSEE